MDKEWSEVKSWIDIKEYYEHSFEGNFIKNILRLTNFLRNVDIISKMTNNIELSNKINGYEEKLIRDQVRNDSLYL